MTGTPCRAQLGPQGLEQPGRGVLGGDVGRAPEHRGEPGDRPDEHDPAAGGAAAAGSAARVTATTPRWVTSMTRRWVARSWSSKRPMAETAGAVDEQVDAGMPAAHLVDDRGDLRPRR